VDKHKSPKIFKQPIFSFTALIPARHEDKVIADTIKAINRIDYPNQKKEAIIICRYDDIETIQKVKECLEELDNDQLKLVVYQEGMVNKPHGLNVGLKYAKNKVVVVFDAEDEPHKDIYKVVNTVMFKSNSDVVQSGVQLMNYDSHWFSTLNVLEYFFWFKSALHFFSSMGVIPLGGNSVFFKKTWLQKIRGWDENCLTEDADIGIRLSRAGAKTTIVYDQEHATREETPDTLSSFIKQRTRWNQGFLQVLLKGDWLKLPHLHQKLLAVYILIWPLMQAMMLLFMPIPILMMLKFKLPIVVAIISVIPLYILALQITTVLVALNEFIRDYKLKHSPLVYLRVLYSFIPFYLVLGISAIRGVGRLITSNSAWEKTAHVNAHRQMNTKENLAYYSSVGIEKAES
jgi:cellulose synthase/poly-beta-1,6-N-acetylglucosamine synthase-like glycosyltransferase